MLIESLVFSIDLRVLKETSETMKENNFEGIFIPDLAPASTDSGVEMSTEMSRCGAVAAISQFFCKLNVTPVTLKKCCGLSKYVLIERQ